MNRSNQPLESGYSKPSQKSGLDQKTGTQKTKNMVYHSKRMIDIDVIIHMYKYIYIYMIIYYVYILCIYIYCIYIYIYVLSHYVPTVCPMIILYIPSFLGNPGAMFLTHMPHPHCPLHSHPRGK